MSSPYCVGVTPAHDVENINTFTFYHQQPTAVPSSQDTSQGFSTAMLPSQIPRPMPPYLLGHQAIVAHNLALQDGLDDGPFLDIRNTMQIYQPNSPTVAAGSLHPQQALSLFIPLQHGVPKPTMGTASQKVAKKDILVSIHLSLCYR